MRNPPRKGAVGFLWNGGVAAPSGDPLGGGYAARAPEYSSRDPVHRRGARIVSSPRVSALACWSRRATARWSGGAASAVMVSRRPLDEALASQATAWWGRGHARVSRVPLECASALSLL
ncbi:MAG: hypothetical protein R2878_12370 [Thermoleophilia bacterium]